MQTLKEKYQARQKRKEEKAFEDWKQSQGKSSVKSGLLFAVLMSVAMTFYRFVGKCFSDEIYGFNELKNDFMITFIASLFGGAAVAFVISRKFQKRRREEIADGKFSG